MIGFITVSPASGHSGIFQVFNKRQYTIYEKIRDTQKLDTSVDRKLPNDRYFMSIFRKIIGCELSHSYSSDLHLRYWVDFASNIVQTEAPYFVDLGLLAINTSDEFGILGTPATRIRRQTDGYHWFAPDHVFGESTAVRMSATWSEQYYSYKTDFGIWRENQDFGGNFFSMSRPLLDLTPIRTNMTNGIVKTTNITTSQLDSIPIGTKMS